MFIVVLYFLYYPCRIESMNRELFYTDEETTGIHPISIDLAIQLLNGHHTRCSDISSAYNKC